MSYYYLQLHDCVNDVSQNAYLTIFFVGANSTSQDGDVGGDRPVHTLGATSPVLPHFLCIPLANTLSQSMAAEDKTARLETGEKMHQFVIRSSFI